MQCTPINHLHSILVILDLLCPCCSHPHYHLQSPPHPVPTLILSSSLSYSYPLAKIHRYFHQTKRLLTPKELLAYTTPSLSALASHATITYYWYHHHQVFRCSRNSITYLIQSCPLQTLQPHLFFSYLSLSFQSSSSLLSSIPCAHCITQYLQVTLAVPPLQPQPSCHLERVPLSP